MAVRTTVTRTALAVTVVAIGVVTIGGSVTWLVERDVAGATFTSWGDAMRWESP